MKYAKPETETAKLVTRIIESRFQKGFIFLLDGFRFIAITAY